MQAPPGDPHQPISNVAYGSKNPNPSRKLACQLSPAADMPAALGWTATCHKRTPAVQQSWMLFDRWSVKGSANCYSAGKNNPDLGELAGLRINLDRASMLLHYDVMAN